MIFSSSDQRKAAAKRQSSVRTFINFQTLILLLSCLGWSQVTVENSRNLDIPEERVQTLHNIVCRAVAEELRVRAQEACGSVTVFLGEAKEGLVADELNGVFTVYLDHWDEASFAMADMRLSVQRLGLSRDRWTRMAREIIKRLNRVTPVSAPDLARVQGASRVSTSKRP
jgi:hypothetical protein